MLPIIVHPDKVGVIVSQVIESCDGYEGAFGGRLI